MQNYETIIFEKIGGVAKITLNRQEVLNAISQKLVGEFLDAIDRIAADETVRVVVITGSGRSFCSGDDLKGMGPPPAEMEGWSQPKRTRNRQAKIMESLRALPKPVIAAINGFAHGAGSDLALACDIRLGSEKAMFKIGYISIGLFPGIGGIWLMSRIMGVNKVAELLFTDEPINAQKAEKLGILNRLVSSEKLEQEVMKMAKRISNGPPIAIKVAKLLLYKDLQLDLATASEDAAAHETITWASQDVKEGIRAFQEKRPPLFKGR